MDISHDDGATSEHNVGRALDFGSTGDFVASVLRRAGQPNDGFRGKIDVSKLSLDVWP